MGQRRRLLQSAVHSANTATTRQPATHPVAAPATPGEQPPSLERQRTSDVTVSEPRVAPGLDSSEEPKASDPPRSTRKMLNLSVEVRDSITSLFSTRRPLTIA
mmetsp:Transcript_40329/g.106973  ORF Transcript_40329/g.106973 Transcript_40329/m.106973 type:complete len:103 (+) Transcript_40329:245-553(+)